MPMPAWRVAPGAISSAAHPRLARGRFTVFGYSVRTVNTGMLSIHHPPAVVHRGAVGLRPPPPPPPSTGVERCGRFRFWQNLYQGAYGAVCRGRPASKWELIRRNPSMGGRRQPYSTDENIFMT